MGKAHRSSRPKGYMTSWSPKPESMQIIRNVQEIISGGRFGAMSVRFSLPYLFSNRKDKFMAEPASLPTTPTDTELAWTAGIIDGEGCITINRRGAKPEVQRASVSHNIFLKVTMGHEPTIRRLHAIFGGIGSVSQQSGGERNNPSWTWWTSSKNTHAVLLAVRPFLVTKAYEADLGLEFLRGEFRAGGKGVRLEPAVVAERDRLWKLLRDAKPTTRFRQAVTA